MPEPVTNGWLAGRVAVLAGDTRPRRRGRLGRCPQIQKKYPQKYPQTSPDSPRTIPDVIGGAGIEFPYVEVLFLRKVPTKIPTKRKVTPLSVRRNIF